MGRIIVIIIPVVILASIVTVTSSNRLQSAKIENSALADKLQVLEDQLTDADAQTLQLEAKLQQAAENAAKAKIENQRRIADLEALLADAKRNAKGSTGRIADLDDADWEDGVAQAEDAPTSKKKKGFGAMLEGMFKDKNMKKMMRQQQMAMLGSTYGALFKRLGLEGEKLEDFKALLVERQMAGAERGMSFLTVGDDKEKMATLVDDIRLQREAADAEIAALLDPKEYEAYKAYEQTVGERMAIGQFATKLQAAGEPLSEDQNEQLIMLMHDNNKQHLGEGFSHNDPGEAMKSMQSAEGIDAVLSKMDAANEALLDQSSEILTPAQQETFATHQKQQAQMQKMGMQMMKTMMQGQGDDDEAPGLIPGNFEIQIQP